MVVDMSHRRDVLGIVQAGGQGSRMDVLTRERAKPALPYAGSYQLIDFALSAFAHSTIVDVWVSVQYQAGSLDPYLAGGRPWDLDRTRGGYRRVVAQQGEAPSEDGFSKGNADDLLRLRRQIEELDPELVVVMSSDHVFACDLDGAVKAHRDKSAEATVVVAEVTKSEARHQGVVTANTQGRVTAFDDKPSSPTTSVVATEIFIYGTEVLIGQLDEIRAERAAAGSLHDGIGDFGDDLLPRLVERGKVFTHPIGSYWRDVGRPETYLQSHRDLLAGKVDVFDLPHHSIISRFPERLPARIRSGAQCREALLAPGCDISGTVVHSVLGPGVRVDKGAHVQDCVIFSDVHIRAGATLGTTIADTGASIGKDATVGEVSTRGRTRDQDITLIGAGSIITDKSIIDPGGRLEPGTHA